jgi:flagellar biosynthesis/type III secretory pathway chaperone
MSALPAKRLASPVLQEFDSILDTLIGLQKKEQQLILARETEELALTTQSIEWMGVRLQGMELDVRRELESARNDKDNPQARIQEKLGQIRRLAQQNRTLLEHSLFFLQQLFQKILERDTPLHLYDMNGHSFRSDLGGGLLETRI